MLIESGYLSHQPVLVAACSEVNGGDVIELGCGFGSTPLLHALARAYRFNITTLESDAAWMEQFTYLRECWHTFRCVDDFSDLPEYSGLYDLAFVDHGQAERRGASIMALWARADLIVAHDSCYGHLYGYEKAFAEFPYKWEYTKASPHTMALSAGDFDLVDNVRRILE